MTPYRISSPPVTSTPSPWPARLRVLAFAGAGYGSILALSWYVGPYESGLPCILIFGGALFASGIWGPWR